MVATEKQNICLSCRQSYIGTHSFLLDNACCKKLPHKCPNASASVHQIEELYMAAVLLRLASVLLVLLPGSVLFHADV